MKTASTVLIVLGIIGVIVFGIQAIQESESFSILGADIAVSKADWTPLIVSGAVLVAGVVLKLAGRK